jgi:hypothetical protein
MAKPIHLGSAGPDDPIYKEGVTMYAKPSFPQQESSPESKAGTPNSQQLPSKTQDEEPPQDDDPNRLETEEDEKELGRLRLFQARHRSQALTGQTNSLLESRSNTQKKTE